MSLVEITRRGRRGQLDTVTKEFKPYGTSEYDLYSHIGEADEHYSLTHHARKAVWDERRDNDDYAVHVSGEWDEESRTIVTEDGERFSVPQHCIHDNASDEELYVISLYDTNEYQYPNPDPERDLLGRAVA